MRTKAYETLADEMVKAKGEDFTLERIYRIVCRAPHQELMSTEQLHSRCGRSISEARKLLGKQGYVIVPGALRHSYRAVKRTR